MPVAVALVGGTLSTTAKVPRLVAILGPTATGKSALGIALAGRFGGEIVSCDSTAVYRGFDIGTDKVPAGEQRGIPHHMVDVADPLEEYSAARYAREAAAAIRDITARGRLPILVGGTGFYYRALTRGLFPGPSRDTALRARLEAVARTRGSSGCTAGCARVDPASAERVQPRDLKRIVRALEVYLLTGRPLTRPLCGDHAGAAGLRGHRVRAGDSGRATRPSASRAGSTRSSSRGCSTRSAGCSRPAFRRPHTPSPGSSTGRRWSICTACAASARRVN